MKKAVMYGGGNIGRGFIGKVFSDSGYAVCFLDIAKPLISEMNEKKEYTVRIVSNDGAVDTRVKNVRAVDAATDAAAYEIAACDIMATAVGVNVLHTIAPTIARGIIKRMENGKAPLDIIICENQIGADQLLRGWINARLTPAQKNWADENIGLVEASIGRMVPPLTKEEREKDPLLICVEPYAELPVDKDAFKGEIPPLAGLIAYTPFDFYIKRKLFVHNMGHAVCAYLGYLEGVKSIWEAVEIPSVRQAAKEAMAASGEALIRQFGSSVEKNVRENIDDLLTRFENRALRDTIARVGRDPARKLRRNDRLTGAALYCIEQGVDPAPIIRGILAALQFAEAGDPTAEDVRAAMRNQNLAFVLERFMGLQKGETLYEQILAAQK